jgi:ligand-binding SRPBCC domain-containing protein
VEITAMEAPTYFRDEQVDGPFAELVHEHYFVALGDDRTRMRDEFRFASPLWVLGSLVDTLVLEWYMRRLLESRNEALKARLEA